MHTRLRHDSSGGCGTTAAATLLQVLLVEDDLGGAALMESSFADRQVATELHHVADGPEALAFLRREGGYADISRSDLIPASPNVVGADNPVRAGPRSWRTEKPRSAVNDRRCSGLPISAGLASRCTVAHSRSLLLLVGALPCLAIVGNTARRQRDSRGL
jgi:hypothetical protein